MILDEKYLKSKATQFFEEDKSQSEDEYIDNLVALLDEIKEDTKKAAQDKLRENDYPINGIVCIGDI